MLKNIFTLFLTLTLGLSAAVAQEKESAEKEVKKQDTAKQETAEKSLAEQLIENPDDTDVFNKYMITNLQKMRQLMADDPKAAKKMLDSMRDTVGALKSEKDATNALINQAKAVVRSMENQLEIAQVSVEELTAKLEKDPTDVKSMNLFVQKMLPEISAMSRSQPEEAEAKLNDAVKFLESIGEKADDEKVTKAIEGATRRFASITRRIESAKKLKALIGEDASELKVETWVNGDAISDDDLKGKVVLLDFWAVWCGPCIRTFPHLREWQEEYADKGLVIIGVTSYYNYEWDEEKGRAVRAKRGTEVEPEAEQEMLNKFAEQYELKHRFAIQTKERELSDYYGVTGIPQVVVVDQKGKIRMIKVGSGPDNAKAIGDLLKELLGESKPE